VKLQRNYKLVVVDPNNLETDVTPPFTLHFTVTRNNLATANTGHIELMNLGADTRQRIYKDRFDMSLNWRCALYAGYGTNLYLVLSGNIHEAFSYKQGPNWITEIDVFDGAYAFQNGFVSQAVAGGADKSETVRQIVGTLPGIQTGFLGAYAQGEGKRGQALFGPTREVLMDQTEGNFFIDNGVLHVSSDFEYDGSETLDLDEGQLLQTPQRRDSSLSIVILFYPQGRVNVAAILNSLYPIYNGTYKICGIHHDVIISESENGKAETSLDLLLLGKAFKALGNT